LIKQEYLRKKQQEMCEEQEQPQPKPKTKAKKQRPKSVLKEEPSIQMLSKCNAASTFLNYAIAILLSYIFANKHLI